MKNSQKGFGLIIILAIIEGMKDFFRIYFSTIIIVFPVVFILIFILNSNFGIQIKTTEHWLNFALATATIVILLPIFFGKFHKNILHYYAPKYLGGMGIIIILLILFLIIFNFF